MKVNKYFLTLSTIIGMCLLYSRCINSSKPDSTDIRGDAYAGSRSCQQCHKDVYNDYQHTQHDKTSWPVMATSLNISASADSFVFNETTRVVVEKRDSGMYQVAYINGKDAIAKRLDIGFGSGEKAYSFGYWQDNSLYQLPLSYFTSIHGWANSPGFPAHQANFQRPIIKRCFECHGSYIAEDAKQAEGLSQVRKLDKNSVVYGIDCERCHGPAAAHVNFQTENPSVKEAHYITRWITLSRQQKLDACGVCHSGNDLTTQRSTFAFVPGDTLSKFYYPEFGSGFSGTQDVHGKQVQLLAASRCFQKSNTMECSSCHNQHLNKVQSVADYSKQCMGCHNRGAQNECPLKASLGDAIVNNCVNCHMPEQASQAISFRQTGKENADAYLLRTHRIAIYKEWTEKVIEQMKRHVAD